jgi:hypothetical protein
MRDTRKRGTADDQTIPDGNLARMTIDGNTGGLIVTLVLLGIGLAGLPAARWFLAASLPIGLLVALVLRFTARDR